MDPILYVFGVLAATAAAQAGLEWWRRRSWAAALYAVLAAVAASPFAAALPDAVIVAGLVVLAVVVGCLLWPHSNGHGSGPDVLDVPDDRADRPGAGGRGEGGGRS